MVQYYDLPLLSIRSAIFPYMIEGRTGFKVDYASRRRKGLKPLPPGEDPEARFYVDGMHPGE